MTVGANYSARVRIVHMHQFPGSMLHDLLIVHPSGVEGGTRYRTDRSAVYRLLNEIGSREMQERARLALDVLLDEIALQPFGHLLPEPMVRSIESDGSVAIELRGKGWRLLVSVEEVAEDSGWSVVRTPSGRLPPLLQDGAMETLPQSVALVMEILRCSRRTGEAVQTTASIPLAGVVSPTQSLNHFYEV